MITATQKTKLNKMNRASQDVSLGTLIQGFQGASVTTVSAAQASASSVAIVTGLSSVSGFVFQQYRSGSLIPYPTGSQVFYTTNVTGTVTISNPAANIIKTSDVIRLVSFQ
jgi:hypothetical protein